MRTKSFLMIVLLCLLVSSCKKNPPSDVNENITANTGIVGKWLWTVTYGGFVGIIKPSPNQVSVIQFTSDGNYYSYSNDTLKRSTSYSVQKGLQRDTVRWADMPTYQQGLYFIGNDTLVLSDFGAYGFGSSYVRIKQ